MAILCILAIAGPSALWPHILPLLTSLPSVLLHTSTLLCSPCHSAGTLPTAPVSNKSVWGRFIGMCPRPTMSLVLISFKWHTPTWGKIRPYSSFCYEKMMCLHLSKFGRSRWGTCHSLSCAPWAWARWLMQKPLAGIHLYRGWWCTVLGDQAVTECNSVTVFKSH